MPATEIREATFFILTALAGGPLHGYGIIEDIESASAGRVQMLAGTLYPALARLVDEGLIADAGTEIVDGRLRHYYQLTDVGAKSLDADVHRMRANANAAAGRLRARTAR